MIATTTSALVLSTAQTLQNALTAEADATKPSQGAVELIPQAAIDLFAMRFSASMMEMLQAQGVSAASPLSKKLRAYSSAGIAPASRSSKFV